MSVWGIIPAAGMGSRIQPLAFSKELLPVGSRFDGMTERPRAVSEYLVDRMLVAGASRICFVIAAGKSDIVEYYGGSVRGAEICYVVQPKAAGLCDALFRVLAFVNPSDVLCIGLPDTVWFPEHGFALLPDDGLSFLLFPVDRPELFDAVETSPDGRVREIQVKRADATTHWVWGAFKITGRVLGDLHRLWVERNRQDEYLGTLVTEWISRGGVATGVRAGQAYVDVGTLNGYREAIGLLSRQRAGHGEAEAPASGRRLYAGERA